MDITDKHRQAFIDLINARFFDVRGGQAIVDFDHEGTIMQVKVNYPTFKRTMQSGTLTFFATSTIIKLNKP